MHKLIVVGKKIGGGDISPVIIAKHSENGSIVALKIISSKNKGYSKFNEIKNEIDIMRKIDHPHIVKIYGFWEDWDLTKKNGDTIKVSFISLELCKGGDVFDWVAQTGNFSEVVARHYFHQLIDGLGYLHSNGISHRDLKLENILFNENFELKIADFGFASSRSSNISSKGTVGYT